MWGEVRWRDGKVNEKTGSHINQWKVGCTNEIDGMHEKQAKTNRDTRGPPNGCEGEGKHADNRKTTTCPRPRWALVHEILA